MTENDMISRRNLLGATSGVASAILIAGCSDTGSNGIDDGDGGSEDSENNGDDGSEDSENNGDDGSEDSENNNDNGTNNLIEPDTQIILESHESGWKGLEPAKIEGKINPTLVLEAGEEYELGWEFGDFTVGHILEIRDEEGNVIDDISLRDPTVSKFEAREEMVQYICDVHSTWMKGDIQFG